MNSNKYNSEYCERGGICVDKLRQKWFADGPPENGQRVCNDSSQSDLLHAPVRY